MLMKSKYTWSFAAFVLICICLRVLDPWNRIAALVAPMDDEQPRKIERYRKQATQQLEEDDDGYEVDHHQGREDEDEEDEDDHTSGTDDSDESITSSMASRTESACSQSTVQQAERKPRRRPPSTVTEESESEAGSSVISVPRNLRPSKASCLTKCKGLPCD
uniref:Uncharacterized protein n=1 Tax=Haptolina ericina TaxID=156174 RepID=A0A7S3ALF3_9EUKA